MSQLPRRSSPAGPAPIPASVPKSMLSSLPPAVLRAARALALALVVPLALSLVVPLALWAGPAAADPLTDVRKLKLDVADVGSFGRSCGLNREDLGKALFEPLGERGVEAVRSGTGYRLFIRATTIAYLQDSCVSYVDAQLLLTTRFVSQANGEEEPGNVQIWTDGGLYASDRDEHAATLALALRQFGNKLAESWDAANSAPAN